MLNFFSKNTPADEMKRAMAAYEKVVSLETDSRDARSMRMRMGLLCCAHLDKTFIAGAEQTAVWQDAVGKATAVGKPAPELPKASRFQKIRVGEADVYAFLPEDVAVEAFGIGARYQRAELPAQKAIEAMQGLANQISYYDLRLQEPFQVLNFLRKELADEAALQEPADGAADKQDPP